MRRQYLRVTCDCCGCERADVRERTIVVGMDRDPAGDSPTPAQRTIDLCEPCHIGPAGRLWASGLADGQAECVVLLLGRMVAERE